jgi:hypothetical protein
VVNTEALEWKPAEALTLGVSLRASQSGLPDHAGVDTRAGYGFDATLVPFKGATLSLDVRRENETGFDGTTGVTDFCYAGFDYQLPHPAVGLHLGGWACDKTLDGTSSGADMSSEIDALISWQINDRLWWSLGVEWDYSKDAASGVATYIRTFKTDLVYQILDNLALGLSLGCGAEQALGATVEAGEQAWSSIRVNAKMRVTNDFKVEAGVGTGSGNNTPGNEILDQQSVYVIATINF